VRVVRVEAVITFAGVSSAAVASQTEAAARLRTAVEAIGGRLENLSCTSQMGRAATKRPQGGDGETGEGG